MAAATALAQTPLEHEPARTPLAEVERPAESRDAVQHAAEHTMLRGVILGTVVGVGLGAVVWGALVALSLMSMDGIALSGPVWMGAAVGVFAGSFLGGWVGVVATAPTLERTEHAQRR